MRGDEPAIVVSVLCALRAQADTCVTWLRVFTPHHGDVGSRQTDDVRNEYRVKVGARPRLAVLIEAQNQSDEKTWQDYVAQAEQRHALRAFFGNLYSIQHSRAEGKHIREIKAT